MLRLQRMNFFVRGGDTIQSIIHSQAQSKGVIKCTHNEDMVRVRMLEGVKNGGLNSFNFKSSTGVGKLWLMGQTWPAARFYK